MKLRIYAIIFFSLLASILLLRFFETIPGAIANPTIHWNQANAFDDSATVTAMANFHKNGFWSSFGLEQRAGMATHSLFNVPCHSNTPSNTNFSDLDHLPRSMDSLTNNCIYTRTPPLHLWWDYLLYWLSNQSVQTLRISSLIFSFLTLVIFYRFLLLVAAPPAAFASIIFFSISNSFWGWTHALYNQPYQYFLLASFLYFIHHPLASRKKCLLLFATTFLLTAMSNELVPFILIYCVLATAPMHRSKWKIKPLVFSLSGIVLSLGAFILLKSLYFKSLNIVWIEISSTLSLRYPVSLDGWRFLKAAYHQLITLVDQLLIPYWMLTAMLSLIAFGGFSAPFRFKEQLRLLLIAAICGVSINFIFIQSSFYHPHLSYRHLIPLILLTVAFFFEVLFQMTKLIPNILARQTFNLYLLFSLCWFAHFDLWSAYFRELQAVKTNTVYKHPHSDFIIQLSSVPNDVTRVHNFDKWYIFMQKNRLVDGLLFNPMLSIEQQSLSLKKNHRYTLIWYFTSPVNWSKLSLYTLKGQGKTISQSCTFQDSLSTSSRVSVSSDGLLDRVDYDLIPTKSLALQLNCKSPELVHLIEVVW